MKKGKRLEFLHTQNLLLIAAVASVKQVPISRVIQAFEKATDEDINEWRQRLRIRAAMAELTYGAFKLDARPACSVVEAELILSDMLG